MGSGTVWMASESGPVRAVMTRACICGEFSRWEGKGSGSRGVVETASSLGPDLDLGQGLAPPAREVRGKRQTVCV